MIGRILLSIVFVLALASPTRAELEGILFPISSMGSYRYTHDALDLTADQKAEFVGFRIESEVAFQSVWKSIRQELRQVEDAKAYQRWAAKHRPLIQQVNYDLWQRACEILGSEDRIQKYHRMLLQDYLQDGRDVLCIASLAGVELSWEQLKSLKSRIAAVQQGLDGQFAEQRRRLEEVRLAPFIAPESLDNLRGKELDWPELDRINSPFRNMPRGTTTLGDTLPFLLTYPEVVEDLSATNPTRDCLRKLVDRTARGPQPASVGVKDATTEEKRRTSQDLAQQRRAADAELVRSVQECLTPAQFQRLKELAVQYCLRDFQYPTVLSIAEIDVEGKQDRVRDAARSARDEADVLRTRLSIALNAKAFDDVVGTRLHAHLGKQVIFVDSQVTGMAFADAPSNPTPGVEPATDGQSASSSTLRVPKSLSTPPDPSIEWDRVEVPDGWTLQDAHDQLQERQWAAAQVVDAFQTWQQRQKELRRNIAAARRNGKAETASKLEAEYDREYRGSAYFDARRQFRTAAEIAHADVVEARRIVRQLGGVPGPATDWQREVR